MGAFRVIFASVGLDPVEGQAYRLLLRLSSASRAELAEQLGCSAAEATDHLHALERKGLVSRVPARSGRFRAVPPELAFAPVHRRQQLESIQSTIGQLGEEFRSQSARHDADELIDVVYGREAVAQRFAQLQLSAEREVLGLLREPMQAVRPSETTASQAALDAGVDYRIVYDAALLEMPGDPYEMARACAAASMRARRSTCRSRWCWSTARPRSSRWRRCRPGMSRRRSPCTAAGCSTRWPRCSTGSGPRPPR
jgi:predicted transcriptional regulator